MKRLSLLLVFSFMLLFSAIAQDNAGIVNPDGKNWFIGAGVRGNVWVNENGHKYLKVWEKPSLGGELFVGKWFSHKVGARLFVDGGTLHPFFTANRVPLALMEDQKYLAGRVDFMLNFTNLFRSWKPDRFYNLIPYIGPGYAHTLSTSANSLYYNRVDNSIMVGAGLLNTFRLSSHVNLYANLGLDVMDAGFDGWKEPSGAKLFKAPSKYNGIASGSIGLIYNFGKAVKKEIVPPPPVVQEVPKYALTVVNGKGSGSYEAGTVVNIAAANCAPDTQTFGGWTGSDANKVANANNANTTITMGSSDATVTATCKNLPPKPAPVVAPAPAPVSLESVFFRLDKSIVDADQVSKIKAAADYLNANPTVKLVVGGNADSQTGNTKHNLDLSKRRVNAVIDMLVNKYNIDRSRLLPDPRGDQQPPFPVTSVRKNRVTKETPNSNEMNRVVIFPTK